MRVLLFLVLLHLPGFSQAQTYPAYTSTYVNDFAELLDAETEARITEMLKSARETRGVEITVVTIESRLDYGASPSIEAFATGLFNFWGVGDATRNDGIMILVARSDREMRIELGKGYPPVFDDRVKRVIEHTFLPWFRQENYPRGIEAGVAETIKRTRLEFDEGGYTTTSRLRLERDNVLESARSGGIFMWIFATLGLTGGGFGLYAIRRWQRNKPRFCDICGRQMTRLSEQADDARLSQGQLVEERLNSKDYDVWYCEHDDSTRMIGYRNWFSSYSACPNCNYRTLHSKRTVLQSATTSSTGRARIDYTCRNCSHAYTETVIIAKKSKSSSSSGSFGGGSSSGGGASGSW